jgi:cleavage and polyadenylation specificity factor subunit 2
LIIDQLDPRCNILATAPVSFFVKNVILNNYEEVCQTYGLFNDLNAINIVGATNPPFTKVQIESVFRKLIPLRYYQSVTMNNKAGTIHFSPYPSGSTIGGAFWRIKSPESDILYAVEFDLKKGQLLDCAKFE